MSEQWPPMSNTNLSLSGFFFFVLFTAVQFSLFGLQTPFGTFTKYLLRTSGRQVLEFVHGYHVFGSASVCMFSTMLFLWVILFVYEKFDKFFGVWDIVVAAKKSSDGQKRVTFSTPETNAKHNNSSSSIPPVLCICCSHSSKFNKNKPTSDISDVQNNMPAALEKNADKKMALWRLHNSM